MEPSSCRRAAESMKNMGWERGCREGLALGRNVINNILGTARAKEFKPLWAVKIWELNETCGYSGKVLVKHNMKFVSDGTGVKIQAEWDSVSEVSRANLSIFHLEVEYR